MTPNGAVTTLAGSGIHGNIYGNATNAAFASITRLAADPAGGIYVLSDNDQEQCSHISYISTNGVVNSIFANAYGRYTRNRLPTALSADNSGNLYCFVFGDDPYSSMDCVLWKIAPAGINSYGVSMPVNGYRDPSVSMTIDNKGNIFIAASKFVAQIFTNGTMRIIAGRVDSSAPADGVGTNAAFSTITDIAVDGSGLLYVCDEGCIRSIDVNAKVTTLTGNLDVWRIAVDRAGNVCTITGTKLLRINPSEDAPVTTTVLGRFVSEYLGQSVDPTDCTDSFGASARFNQPSAVAIDTNGAIIVLEQGNSTIRKITADRTVTTLAGQAGVTGTSDGSGSAARFAHPMGMTIDTKGNLYVADSDSHTVRKVTSEGNTTTLAGVAGESGSVDGPRGTAKFAFPHDAVADRAGNVYVADRGNHTIRKIDCSGTTSTVAGFAGESGFRDGTNTARFNKPSGLAIDGSGNLIVADSANHVIRKISITSTNYVVTTIAGSNSLSGMTDGAGNAARFNSPKGLVVNSAGYIYVNDTGNGNVRQISPGGMVTTINTIIGVNSGITNPVGVTMDRTGDLFVTDSTRHIIVKGYPLVQAPGMIIEPLDRDVPVGQAVVFNAGVGGIPAPSLHWQRSADGNGTWIDLANGTNYTGTATATLNLNSATADMDGFRFRLIATNSLGSCTSRVALLKISVPPSFRTQPANAALQAGATATFHANVEGNPVPSVRWQRSTDGGANWMDMIDQTAISGSATASLRIDSITPQMNGNLFRLAATNSAGALASLPATLTVQTETVKPVLTVTTKLPAAKVYDALLNLTGTASDNISVASVLCQVNSGQWMPVQGTTRWYASITLSPGTNAIQIKAIDASNNSSVVKKITIIYSLKQSITLETAFQGVAGGGRVTGITNLQLLELGKYYRVTATSYSSNLFVRWSGSVSSTNPVLDFQMKSNMTLTALFVPNPFIAGKGVFNGLFYSQTGIDANNCGSVTLTMTDKGSMSGRLQFPSGTISFTKQFAVDGTAQFSVLNPQKQTIDVNLALDIASGSAFVTGTLTAGTWQAPIRAGLVGQYAAAKATARYTMIIPGSETATFSPAGDGPISASISKGGTVSIAGSLGDGIAITQGTSILKDGTLPFFAMNPGREFAIGWLLFNTNDTVSGSEVRWVKLPAKMDMLYPNGFNVATAITGARYATPAANSNILDWTNGVISVSGGNILDFTNGVRLAKNMLAVVNNANKVTGTLVGNTGAFSGSFTHPAARRTVKFTGVVVQSPEGDWASGWFLGTNQSGRITIEPN